MRLKISTCSPIGTKISPKEAPAAKEFTEPIERASIPDAASSHVSGAGSFAFTFGDNRASANLDNLNINNSDKLNALASDNTFRGALTGSAAINIFSGDASNGASQKSFNAGVAFNKSITNVDSVISNSDITNSQLLTNVAQSSGSDVAVGLSGGMNSSSSGKQNAFTTDFSFNYSNNNVHAARSAWLTPISKMMYKAALRAANIPNSPPLMFKPSKRKCN